MAVEAAANYSPIPTGDDGHGAGAQQEHVEEEAHDDVHHNVQGHSPHDSETTNVPTIEISPPPSPGPPLSPPTRLNSTSTDTSSMSQTLSQPSARPAGPSLDTKRYSTQSGWKERIYGSITPSLHEILEVKPSDHNTSREYSHRKQRNRLWRLTIGEWINSLILCVVYFGILYTYSRKHTISVPQRRIFNSLTTGVSLLLGVNLAASLRSYAKLLRWRMLAASYRPLETFDLVMGCDSLLNVFKLLWKAQNQRRRYLPSITQALCVIWLLIHLAVTVLVGIIGLNYNLDTSTEFVLTRKGNASIVDLNGLSTGDYSYDLAQVQEWGVRGEIATPLDDESGVVEYFQSYFSSWDGFTFYYFQDQNPDDSSSVDVSSRYIISDAYCQDYTVTDGRYGNLSYIIYRDGAENVNRSIPASPGPGGLLTISKLNSTCGDGCVEIHSFQAAAYPDGNGSIDADEDSVGAYFICNNTVPQVADDYNEVTIDYEIYSIVARMLAGAIGWSDNPPTADGEEYAVYTNSSRMSFLETPGATDMASLISSFTMGAISIMDNSPGMYRKIVTSRNQPFPAQVLKVKWRYAGAILGVIPLIHFCTLVAVILWANKVIIKDDSHLAIAKVYHTLLSQLGDRGCLLRGDEIVAVMGNPHVVYAWQASSELDRAMHVDVFQDWTRVEKVFAEGIYDGSSKTNCSTANTGRTGSIRKRYRDVDAADYF